MMLRSFFLTLALLGVTLSEASFFSALLFPFSAIPLTFVIGVLLYHFLRPSIGAAWMVGGGILLDLFSLPGVSHTLAFAAAALLGALLARNVFANRSLYATIGLGSCMYGCALVVELIWIASAAASSGYALTLNQASAFFWGREFLFIVVLLLAYSVSRRGAASLRRFFFFRS